MNTPQTNEWRRPDEQVADDGMKCLNGIGGLSNVLLLLLTYLLTAIGVSIGGSSPRRRTNCGTQVLTSVICHQPNPLQVMKTQTVHKCRHVHTCVLPTECLPNWRTELAYMWIQTISTAMSACTEQLGFHWTDFHEIWHLSFFSKICRWNSCFIKIWHE